MGTIAPRKIWTGKEFPRNSRPACFTDTSEPEPDLMVLTRPLSELGRNHQPEDIALIVEVADSGLEVDLKRKAELYARAGIQEYWILISRTGR